MMPLANILVYGFRDAINPCNLSTMVLFAALLGLLRRRQLPYIRLGWIFVVVSYMASLIFLAGGLMNILYSILFFQVVRIIYVIVGIVFVVVGIIHLIDWIRIRRGGLSKILLALSDDGKGKSFPKIAGVFIVIAIAVYLNAIATIWPSNSYISFYLNFINIPGERKEAIIMLFIYSLMMIAPLAVAMLWIFWSSPCGWGTKSPAKAKMVLSSVLLGLGGCLVYIFH